MFYFMFFTNCLKNAHIKMLKLKLGVFGKPCAFPTYQDFSAKNCTILPPKNKYDFYN